MYVCQGRKSLCSSHELVFDCHWLAFLFNFSHGLEFCNSPKQSYNRFKSTDVKKTNRQTNKNRRCTSLVAPSFMHALVTQRLANTQCWSDIHLSRGLRMCTFTGNCRWSGNHILVLNTLDQSCIPHTVSILPTVLSDLDLESP